MAELKKIGFIGLGIMGVGMAKNLANKLGHKLVVWNRDETKSQQLASEIGCEIAPTAKAVIETCEMTFSMLSTLEASEAVFNGPEGVLAGISTGKCLVDCATLTAEHMQATSAAVHERGGLFLEAPVSGSKAQASGGTLIFLCGGDKEIYDRIQPELDAMGKVSYHLGPVGKGSQMKIVVNMTMGTMMNALSEGIALAECCELPTDDLVQILDQGAMGCPMFRGKGPLMIKKEYAPAFPLKHAQKDMRFAINLGDDLGLPLPVAAAANEQFKKARNEYGDNDFCAVMEAARKK